MADTEDDFIEKFESERASDGYGLVMDRGTAEKQEMAEAFDAPDVGTKMPENEGDDDQDPSIELPSTAPATAEAESMPVAQAVAVGVALPPLDEAEAEAAKPAPEKSMSFGEAFKAARAAGKKDFSWINPKTGKSQKFTTKLKSEVVRPKAMPAPVADQPKESAASEPLPDGAPPQAALVQKESTSGIGPRLNPAMQPRPGARGIYEGAAIGPNTRRELAAKIDRARNAKVTPMTVTGEDGAQRPARSVAELMSARKAAQ